MTAQAETCVLVGGPGDGVTAPRLPVVRFALPVTASYAGRWRRSRRAGPGLRDELLYTAEKFAARYPIPGFQYEWVPDYPGGWPVWWTRVWVLPERKAAIEAQAESLNSAVETLMRRRGEWQVSRWRGELDQCDDESLRALLWIGNTEAQRWVDDEVAQLVSLMTPGHAMGFDFGRSGECRITFPDGRVVVTNRISIEMYEDPYLRPELLKLARELRGMLDERSTHERSQMVSDKQEMCFDIGGRQSGKTTRLIDWMLAAPEGERRVLVSHSRDEARRLEREYRAEYPSGALQSWQFVTAGDLERLHGHGRVVLAIDNLDLVLPQLVRLPVGYVSATGQLTRLGLFN